MQQRVRSLKENPLKREDLDDFAACYGPKTAMSEKNPSVSKVSLNLDIFWLKDESLEDSANLPGPDIIAAEIVEDLQAALAQFAEIASDLKQ
jgi:type I restriction enzyme M protein